MTDDGAFEVLAGPDGSDGRLVGYEELSRRATTIVGADVVVCVASLEDIIVAKERADGAKDRESLPQPRAVQDAGGDGGAWRTRVR